MRCWPARTREIGVAVVAAVALGVGTALVYPTLIAAISDAVSPVARASMVGVYRFWRDMGYVAGGLIAGIAADAIDYEGAIAIVAALTAASGLWVALDMPGGRGSHQLQQPAPQVAATDNAQQPSPRQVSSPSLTATTR